MTEKSSEPANLVFELLRQMRAENNSRFDALSSKLDTLGVKNEVEFKAVRHEISVIRRQTIGEVYRSNKTFASIADFEERLEALEHRVFSKA